MPKTIRGICPDLTCEYVVKAMKAQEEEIKKENEEREKANAGLIKSKQKKLLKVTQSVAKASEEVAEKLGIPKATVRTIYRRNVLKTEPGSGEPTQKEITLIKVIDNTIVGSDGKIEVDTELKIIDNVRYLVVQEIKIGSEGARIKTGNHYNLTLDIINQFKDFLGGLNIEELKTTEPPVPKKVSKK